MPAHHDAPESSARSHNTFLAHRFRKRTVPSECEREKTGSGRRMAASPTEDDNLLSNDDLPWLRVSALCQLYPRLICVHARA